MLRFSIARLILRKRRRPPPEIILRDIEPPLGLRTDLERIHLAVVRAWWTAARDQLLPAYRRSLDQIISAGKAMPVMDDSAEIGTTASGISDLIDRLILNLTPSLRDWAIRVESWHRSRWGTSLNPTGIDLATLLGPEDVAETVSARIEANVSLIRSISSESRSRIEGIIFRGLTARTPARDVAREISASVSMSRQRALRIAVDQLQKMASELDTARMEQAGIDEFEWVHSGKVHPRPWHLERNGKRYKLRGDIPPDDMPGIPPYCGCRKKAVISLK